MKAYRPVGRAGRAILVALTLTPAVWTTTATAKNDRRRQCTAPGDGHTVECHSDQDGADGLSGL